MSLPSSFARAPRCLLANVVSGESIRCLFNPSQLTEKLQVNWNRLVVPGLSYQPLQFQSTSNRQLAGVEFYLDRMFASAQPGNVNIRDFRAFLRALTVPPAGAQGVPATAPPRLIFMWPGVITLECVVASAEFQYKQIAIGGTVLVYTATVTFEEILDARVTSEELREEVEQ